MDSQHCHHQHKNEHIPVMSEHAQRYTCPMHPEIQQDQPGDCPLCGMALEPSGDSLNSSTQTEYSCPMHLEIVRNKPGDCPICGMALEPKIATANTENTELIKMNRRFWIV